MFMIFVFYFHFPVGRYLIAGGSISDPYDSSEITEVVELVKTNSTPSFGQLPTRFRVGPVGAMFGNAPIICGGYISHIGADTCISFQNSQWSRSHPMTQERQYAAGVQLNSTTLWILGGHKFSNSRSLLWHDSTEFIIQGQFWGVPGPKLPNELALSCAVKLSDEAIFVIGGTNGYGDAKKAVWIYNPQNGFSRRHGPPLNHGRYGHSCSTMIFDADVGVRKVIVVAGGARDSVEIYDPTDNTWHSGKTIFPSTKNIFIYHFKYKLNQNT